MGALALDKRHVMPVSEFVKYVRPMDYGPTWTSVQRNARLTRSYEAKFSEDIKSRGIRKSVIVHRRPDGSHHLTNGHHRLAQALDYDLPVPFIIRDTYRQS